MLKNYFMGGYVYELPLVRLEHENVLGCQFNKRMILSLDWLDEKGIGLSKAWRLRYMEMKSIKIFLFVECLHNLKYIFCFSF